MITHFEPKSVLLCGWMSILTTVVMILLSVSVTGRESLDFHSATKIASPKNLLKRSLYNSNPEIGSTSLSVNTEICDNGIDDDGDGLIDCQDSDCTDLSYNSVDVPKTIGTTPVTITSTLTISDFGSISDLNIINLDISHTYTSDLTIKISSPSGTTIDLMNSPCGSQNNIDIQFDDEASSSNFPCPATNGQAYIPTNALSAFDGQEINGVWTLTVIDGAHADGGSLNSWGLDFTLECTSSEICTNGIDDDGDGLVDCNDPDCNNSSNCVVCNLTTNGQFENGLIDWVLENNSPATSTISIDNSSQLSGENSAFIDITNTDGTNWHTQFRYNNVPVDVSKFYNISFEAKATSSKVINVAIQQMNSPYNTYYYSSDITITSTAQTYTISNISVSATDNSAALKFYLSNDLSDIWIDNIILEEIGCSSSGGFDNEVCYFIEDGSSNSSAEDYFYTFNYITGSVTPIGPTGTYAIEAMAMDTVNGIIYATDADEFGKINLLNGAFSTISNDVGAADGALGLLNINDIDGMTYDHSNNIIWASERRSGSNGEPDDLLVQIDPITGTIIQDAFGAGIGYVVVNTPENDLDDIAIAEDGTLYGISNYGGSGNQAFGSINKTNGTWTELGDYGIQDVESLAFTASGQLVATTGNEGSPKNELYTIDVGTGLATLVGSMSPAQDIEACDCISAMLINLQVGDQVWNDIDKDGIQDSGEPGIEGVNVNLLTSTGNPYLNEQGNPTTTVTDVNGQYLFDELPEGQFIVEFILPSNAVFTSQNAGGDDDIDSDADTTTGRSPIFTLSGSTNNYSIDAGVTFSEICDNGIDDDGDGLIDCGDDECDGEVNCPTMSCSERVTQGLIALYEFNEGSGTTIIDVSGYGNPLNLTIQDPGNISWNGDCGLSINSNTQITSSGPASKITDAVQTSNEITIEAWVKPANLTQSGPSRIVSISENISVRNITLGQSAGEYVARARTSDGSTSNNGTPELQSNNGVTLAHVQHVVYTFDGASNEEKIFVDGVLKESDTRLGDFSNWDDTYKLILGNELTNDRTFLGEIYSVAFYDRALNTSEIINNLNTGACCNGNPITEPESSCVDGTEIELFSTGLKNDIPKTLTLTDPSNIDSVLVEIVYKSNNVGATLEVEDENGNLYTANRISVGVNAYVYSVKIPNSVSSITYTNQTNESSAQSMVAYAYRDGQPGKSYAAQFTVLGGYNGTETIDFVLPARTDTNDINIVLPVSEITYDNRVLNFTATAGSDSYSFTKMWGSNGEGFPDGCCIDTVAISFANVPPDVPIISIEVESPSGSGQSFVIAGIVYTEIICSDNEYCTLSAEAGLDTTICASSSIGLNAVANSGNGPFTYEWSNGLGSGSNKTVIPGSTTKYFVTISDASGCSDVDSITVNVNPDISVIIDYNGSPCLETNSTISAEASGGSGNYIYSWTGPNGFTSTQDTISIIDDGNYYVTVSDEYGCESNTSGYVYEAYEPFIFTLNTTICEGESVDLSVNSASAVAYQWGANAASATSSAVTVTPAPPSTTYYVTVTNDVGCQTTASATINVNEKTNVNITGPTAICIGETSQLSPASGGTWISTNSSVAVVSNSGEITAVGAGTASFIFTDGSTNCDSDPSASITVHPKPVVNVTGPTELCIGFQTTLSPTTGGTWISTNTSVATVDNSGNVTAVGPGNVTFIFTDGNTSCDSDETISITIHPIPVTNYVGNDSICIGGSSTISPTSGGTWTSLDHTIATIDNNGNITGLAAGTTRFIFTNSATSCVSDTTLPFTVMPDPVVNITGPTAICIGSTTTLSPTSGGSWVSNNPSVATVNNMGIVTGVSGGTANFTYTSYLGCVSPATADVSVDNKEGATITGDNQGCLGYDIQLTSSKGGGTWMSDNPAIATVNNSGLVTPVSEGTVQIIYEHNSGACENEATFSIIFSSTPTVNITGSDSICVGDLTTLSPSSGGTWVSSDPNIATVGNDGTVVGISGGQVNFTFTSNASGCESNATSFITVSPELAMNIEFNGSICLEDTTKLTANVTGGTAPLSYSWNGPSGFTSTLSTVDISEDGNYYVTVTDAFGCQVNTSAFVYERYEPFIFGLNTEVCEGEQVTLSINSNTAVGYQWGANANDATTSSVVVVPTPPSTDYSVTVTNDIGCVTTASATIDVIEKPQVGFSGPDQICEGETTNVTPSTGGIWISSKNSVAIVNDQGLVTGVSAGSATFSYKDTTTGCWSDPTTVITVTDNGAVNITGDNAGCIGSSFQLSPSVGGGLWTSSNTSIATVDSDGWVTGVASGSVTITYDPNSATCLEISDVSVTIYNDPTVAFTGPTSICIGSTSTLSPNTGGTWSSSDENVATVSNSGLITAVGGGTALFTFTSDNGGCDATTSSPISVIDDTNVSLNGPSSLCIGSTTSLSPSTGGIWISSDNGIATVNSSGLVIAQSEGTATFTFYESTNGCMATETIDVIVNASLDPSFAGPDELCIGDTTYINPSSGGTWVSNNPSVATIDNNGMIISVSSGNVKFTYTNTATGCVSNESQPLVVNPKPSVSLLGQTEVCVGEQVTISPNSGGTWVSLDPSIAMINNQGIVTGVATGTTTFIFTNDATNCSSDPTGAFTVNSGTDVGYSGPTEICVGDTSSLYPSTGGSWSSNNTSVATVTPDGKITALSGGSTSFTFINALGCSSNTPATLSVLPQPNISLVGANGICIGSNTYFTPTSGGSWTSNDESVATITNGGVVTGISQGSATFVFTNSMTGCSSPASTPISVYSEPITQITGPNQICIGSSTTMSPTSGGTWTSNNPTIAGISNSGIVTAYAVGQATFTFVENGSGCTSAPSQPITITDKPVVQITGPSNICEGTGTTLSPTVGGAWTSTNPTVASVDNNGNVQGLSQGIARFIFTSDQGCVSDQTAPVLVYGKPTVYNPGPDDLCVGDMVNLLPSTGGTWSSSNNSIATITNDGEVTGIAPGSVRFTFVDANTGCESDSSDLITVNDKPIISIQGSDSICIGSITQLAPTNGGLWYSNDPSIATITNSGLVTGINAGSATFYYQNSTTNCSSDDSDPIFVEPKPNPQFVGGNEICVGDTTYVLPSSGGTWQSDNPSIAVIDNNGMITSLSSGLVRFKFTKTGSCTSDWSAPLTVNAPPSVGFVGSSNLCIDGTAQLYPNSGGSWQSSDDAIATVDNMGAIEGKSEGEVYFTFTNSTTGCSSDGSLMATVIAPPQINVNGDSNICVGYTTQLGSTSSGVWQSSDDRIAMVSNSGVVTGLAPGKVTIELIDALTGCSSGLNSVEITVGKCINHDFNVTTTTLTIEGDISTNDNLLNSTYSIYPYLASKPAGSMPNLSMNSDGTYSFSSTIPGKYLYEVEVCNDVVLLGCPTTTLEITVLGDIYGGDNPVNNLEFYTVFAHSDNAVDGTNVLIDIMANDHCVNTLECEIDPSSLSITDSGSLGGNAVDNTDMIDYFPYAGNLGEDTVSYEVCTMSGTTCSASSTYITISHPTADNSVVAPDDFGFAMAGETITGNVRLNDSDPEGDSINVVPLGTNANPIVIPEGSYYIETNGDFSFTPATGYVGGVNIIYTLCDNNPNQACTNATLHLLVEGDMSINLRVYLEGALILNEGATASNGRPLMRDDLRNSPYTGLNYIPTQDPYSGYVGYLDLSANFEHVGPGLLNDHKSILDSAAVFGVEGENAIVDWVFVQIRDKNDNTNVVATRSGLVQRDGDIVDLDGISPLKFTGVGLDSFFVVVKHRSHLGVMSGLVGNSALIDFTDPGTEVFNFGTSLGSGLDYTGLSQNANIKQGYRCLWAGDFDASGKVKFTNPGDDQNILFADVLFHPENALAKANFDFGYGYYQGDYNMNAKVKFANPDDDKNMLFSQLLLYPLNTNLLDNYNFFIEQIPSSTSGGLKGNKGKILFD